LDGTGGDSTRSAANLEVELMREHDEVIGRGRVRGTFELSCSRCLEAARVPIDARIDLLFRREEGGPGESRGSAAAEGSGIPFEENDPDVFLHDGITLSLREPLRELLIAELPISPLCDDACRGLCPTCGANQNTEAGRACGHARTPEGRFAGLADLKIPT
jgi:uncharacterized protein